MPEYDAENNKLTLKIVFYGPALSGKTTNLTYLHDILMPELKGDMMVLETKNDRTLFFDLLPLGLTTPSGLLIKIKLFTVPGQVSHDSTRKAVLSRSDGVLFVADSQTSQSINNGESFENLVNNCARVGLDLKKLPLVIQFNKRDLDNIVPEDELNERWSETPWKLFFSSALKGQGVKQSFEGLLSAVYDSIDIEYSISDKHRLTKDMFINGITRSST